MTDRAIFSSLGGANQAMIQMELAVNNLANANTAGFRADYAVVTSTVVQTTDLQTRDTTMVSSTYSDFKPGPIVQTGRDLDVAINGSGFIAVQNPQGQEGYTRGGNLKINAHGMLVTNKGELVLGEKGVITIPNTERVSINKQGEISAILVGGKDKDVVKLDKIKLVDASIKQLQKGADGLFYLVGGGAAKPGDNVRLIPESLEGSNVDTVKAMVDLIDYSRNFEYQTKLMKVMENNSSRSNQLLNITE